MSRQTYPHFFDGNSTVEPLNYVRNSRSSPPSNTGQLQRRDYIQTPPTLCATVHDMSESLVAISQDIEKHPMTAQMKKLTEQLFEDLKELWGLIQELSESHRNTANAIRSITDFYGSRQGEDPTQDIKAAKDAVDHALRRLLNVTRRLMTRAEDLRTTSAQNRELKKVIGAAMVNYRIYDTVTATAPYIAVATNAWHINEIIHLQDAESYFTGTKSAILIASTLFSAVLSSMGAFKYFSPEAEAYKKSNWSGVQSAMEKVHVELMKLVDLIGGLDLYLRRLKKRDLGGKRPNIQSLLNIASTLDKNVDACRGICNSIRRSGVDVPPLEGWTVIEQERVSFIEQMTWPGPSQESALVRTSTAPASAPSSSQSRGTRLHKSREHTYPPRTR